MFGNKSDVVWAVVFVSPILYPFRMKVVRLIIFKFFSSIFHPVPSPQGALVGLFPQTKLQVPKLKYETLLISGFLLNFNVKPPAQTVTPPAQT